MKQPFHDHVALTIESAGNGRARLRMKWRPEHALLSGILHGGFLAIIADATVHTAAHTLLKPAPLLDRWEVGRVAHGSEGPTSRQAAAVCRDSSLVVAFRPTAGRDQ